MAFKFVILFATLAAVNCGVLQPAGVYQHTQAIYPQQQATIVKQPAYNGWQQPANNAWQQPANNAWQQPTIIKQVVPVIKKIVEHEEPANYNFEYSVNDPHTGDVKHQHEEAKNGAISGFYTLNDADGYKRIVHYTADDVHGFNANVERQPLEGHKIIKVAQPAIAIQKVIAQPTIAVQKVIAQPAYNSGWQQPANNAWQQPSNNAWQQPARSYYH